MSIIFAIIYKECKEILIAKKKKKQKKKNKKKQTTKTKTKTKNKTKKQQKKKKQKQKTLYVRIRFTDSSKFELVIHVLAIRVTYVTKNCENA